MPQLQQPKHSRAPCKPSKCSLHSRAPLQTHRQAWTGAEQERGQARQTLRPHSTAGLAGLSSCIPGNRFAAPFPAARPAEPACCAATWRPRGETAAPPNAPGTNSGWAQRGKGAIDLRHLHTSSASSTDQGDRYMTSRHKSRRPTYWKFKCTAFSSVVKGITEWSILLFPLSFYNKYQQNYKNN